MKKLSRGVAPVCLAKFKHGRDNWSVIRENGLYSEIWRELNDMQKGFCAYCECRLYENKSKRHIEHFIQRDKDPRLTFDWNNLFGSCNNSNRCGRYKDNSPAARQIDLKKVCKPDVMDSSKLMLFLSSGEVRPRTNLDPQKKEFADNTIAIFNLNDDTKLVNSRKAAISAEKSLADEYLKMSVEITSLEDDGSLAELLQEELDEALVRIRSFEYSTALEHLWIYNKQF